MNLPSYYLSRPAADLSSELADSFDRLYSEQLLNAAGEAVDYSLGAPKWQFLNYLADTKDVVMHGSGESTIAEFQPRQSNSSEEFGDQKAVYAASDGIWAMYFAIIDRDRFVQSLINTCTRTVDSDGNSESHYFFSINEDAIPHQPWRTGTVYILPRKTFEPQSKDSETGVAQWRSFVAVKPLATIEVSPSDFPFLDQIRGHNLADIQKRVAEDPNGFPWLYD